MSRAGSQLGLRRFISLPVLAKELVERAMRLRTYMTRVGAGLLLGIVFWASNRWVLHNNSADLYLVLGAGSEMFRSLVRILFAGIYLFVPAIFCGVVTQEKERDSLALLLLTELRPSQIVLQKYLAGLVPVLTLLMLALPLGAVAYSYGGFSADELSFSLLMLFLGVLQIAAIAVWCSCRFRSTVTAFVGTYLFGFLLLCGVPWVLKELIITGPHTPRMSMIPHVPWLAVAFGNRDPLSRFYSIEAVVGTTVFFLFLAIRALPRYAFAPARPWLREFFLRIDAIMHGLNRLFGSVTFRKGKHALPGNQPIFWRELRARALARPEYLMRLLLAVEIPVLAITLSNPVGDEDFVDVSLPAAITGTFAVIVLSIAAANSFVTERVNQTLDVLLTTPLRATDFVRQKARALRGLTIVLGVPVLTSFLPHGMIRHSSLRGDRADHYLLISVLTVVICLPLTGWIGFWVGMMCRTRLRAIVTTLSIIVGWCALPLLAAVVVDAEPDQHGWLFALSPLGIPALNEFSELPRLPTWIIGLHFVLTGGALCFLRAHCLRNADAYLRR